MVSEVSLISNRTPVQAAEPDRAAASDLLRMIWGIHISRAVYAVAELGIPDLLADGPLSSAELAESTGTLEPLLFRVLRLLTALGVFDEPEPARFGLTSVGGRLRSDVPVGMRSWALLSEALGGVRPFAHIVETLRTGRSGAEIEFGTRLIDQLVRQPEALATFNAAMSERTAAFAPSVADGYDFSALRTIVDVGGGQGTLLLEILRHHNHLRGVLFEHPAVAPSAQQLVRDAHREDRCEVVAGDFFAGVPSGADCYVVANVLHDWDNARSTEILRNCRQAMAPGGRVLIVERLIPDRPEEALPALLSDINMMVLTGGQERTNVQYAELLGAAQMTIGEVVPVAAPYGVIEGYPA